MEIPDGKQLRRMVYSNTMQVRHMWLWILTAVAMQAQSTVPPAVVPAFANRVTVKLTMKGLGAAPADGDLVAGMLVNEQFPSLRTIPTVSVKSAVQEGQNWAVTLELSGLIPFGASSVPLFYKGAAAETVRLQKTGLSVQPRSDVAVTEGQDELLVLENPSDVEYSSVRARLRFQDVDVCTFRAEQFQGGPKATPSVPAAAGCEQLDRWTTFNVPKYAAVSLRFRPDASWFRDYGTWIARSAKRKGTLTLRFWDSGQPVINEQVIPLELQFNPKTLSLFRSLLLVFACLLLGAFVSLVLRVTIPNYRRSRNLKDQLTDLAKATRAISDDVESSLRVQLRVERLTLDSVRKSVVSFGPNFGEVAVRVEQGVATLKRRIEYARRLDTAYGRKRLLIAEEQSPPSLIHAIDRQLTAVCEALKRSQFSEQDWVFIQQKLEAADKLLGEPSEEEKSAFEATLIQRWKAVRDHFGVNQGALVVPTVLQGMEACFPPASSLPAAQDTDGSQWIKSIGIIRADLQISALELLREFEFLAPATASGAEPRWQEAKTCLNRWLATPALETLADARRLLRELSEGIDAKQIVDALSACEAEIEMDPQFFQEQEQVRLSVRFRQVRWNSAVARQHVACEWQFRAPQVKSRGWRGVPLLGRFAPSSEPEPVDQPVSGSTPYRERGWEIYHYFEKGTASVDVSVTFYYQGKLVPLSDCGAQKPYFRHIDLAGQRGAKRAMSDRRERWRRGLFEAVELVAVLLVPLAALTVSTTNEGNSGRWWELVGLGFGSETIRNVLSGKQDQSQGKPNP